MDLLTTLITIFSSGSLTAVIMHFLNRRARHAETRLKNAEAAQSELTNKRTEVDHYREVINDLVSDMKVLRVDQDATDKRYQENTRGLHQKLDTANLALVKANETIDRLETEGKRDSEETRALSLGLKRANDALDKANAEITGLREEISGLQDRINELLVERAEKK